MAIDATIKAKQLNGVYGSGSGYGSGIELEVDGMELTQFLGADDVVSEFDNSDLLEAIGTSDVIEWLEAEGYTITQD